MKHVKHETEKSREANAIDAIERMWDRELAKGDDEFYKTSFRQHRKKPEKIKTDLTV